MLIYLLVGLPGERPGGLLLTIMFFFFAGTGAFALGLAVATVEVLFPQLGFAIKAVCALFRGTPVILLMFLFAQTPGISPNIAGVTALICYSFSHVTEIIRPVLLAYPKYLAEQARIMGINRFSVWLHIQIPWAIKNAWKVLVTHWVSLLKDTGALVILGIGELTTIAKSLSEASPNYYSWSSVLFLSAILYLISTLAFLWILKIVDNKTKTGGWYRNLLNDSIRKENL